MTNYPNFYQWQALLLGQYSGELAFSGFITGLLMLWLLWRGLFQRWQVVITFAVVGMFLFSITRSPLLDVFGLVHILAVQCATWFMVLRFKPIKDQVLFTILGTAFIVRLPNLLTERFWYDEATTAAFSQVPINHIFALGGDTHPPLFYLPFWTSAHIFGTSEFALRLPSLLFGVLTVYMIYRLTLALGMKRETALVAALIIAVLPGALRYSDEARAYSQLAVCVLGMAIAVLEDRPRWFACFAAVTVLTQNIGYLYVATIGGVAFFWYVHRTTILDATTPGNGWWREYWSPGPFRFYFDVVTWWRWALLIPAAVGLAWLPFLIRQLHSISAGWWVVFSPGAIIRPLFELTIGVRVTESLLLQVLAAVLVLTLLGLLARAKWLLTTKGNLWFVLCFATPALTAAISLWTPIYVNRAFLPSFLAIPIVWAYLITERKTYERIAAAAVLIPVLAIALQSYYVPDREKRVDWSAVLPAACGNTQTVFTTNLSLYMVARYYLPDRDVLVWTNANDISLFLPESVKEAMSIEQVDSPPHGDVCVLDSSSMLSRQVERDYVAALMTNPHGEPITVSSEVDSDITASIVSVQ